MSASTWSRTLRSQFARRCYLLHTLVRLTDSTRLPPATAAVAAATYRIGQLEETERHDADQQTFDKNSNARWFEGDERSQSGSPAKSSTTLHIWWSGARRRQSRRPSVTSGSVPALGRSESGSVTERSQVQRDVRADTPQETGVSRMRRMRCHLGRKLLFAVRTAQTHHRRPREVALGSLATGSSDLLGC